VSTTRLVIHVVMVASIVLGILVGILVYGALGG
jgi:hypothetical protein